MFISIAAKELLILSICLAILPNFLPIITAKKLKNILNIKTRSM